MYIIVSSADARTGPRPESSGNADSQRAPRIAAAAAGGSAPAPGAEGDQWTMPRTTAPWYLLKPRRVAPGELIYFH